MLISNTGLKEIETQPKPLKGIQIVRFIVKIAFSRSLVVSCRMMFHDRPNIFCKIFSKKGPKRTIITFET